MKSAIKPKNKRLWLPLDMAKYVCEKRSWKCLRIYFFLKFYTDGKIQKNSSLFDQMKKELGCKDPRTCRKYFRELINQKWIGYCRADGIFFVRSLKTIIEKNGFTGSKDVLVKPDDLKNFQAFLAAAVVGEKIKKDEYYWDVVFKRGLNRAPDKRADALQRKASSHTPKRPLYFGLSNKSIGKLLGYQKSRASELKNTAARHGNLKVRHRYEIVAELKEPDYYIRRNMYKHAPELEGRLIFWSKKRAGLKKIKLLRQLHDEIIVKLHIKKRKRNYSSSMPRGDIPRTILLPQKAA